MYVGGNKSGQKGNHVWLTDGAGGMEGLNGHVYFRDSWANENNQHNIYARFA